MVEEGDRAPAFAVNDQTGKKVSLTDFKGKIVVIYFYPKDDTPGCTVEACSLRDSFTSVKKTGATVLGVSCDNEKSHRKFIEKYSLPFALLADTDKSVANAYDVWKEKSFYGKTFMGVARTTFIIDGKGIVKKVFRNVKPEDHAQEILDAIKKMKKTKGKGNKR